MRRLIDVLLIFISAPVLLPILLVVTVLVRLRLGSPVFFSQIRAGQFGKPFKMFKFRSMTNECDSSGNLLPDEQRLTRFGKLLRSTSLDEFPSFWNVLKGDMSLVGPRPLLTDYIDYYSSEQARRLDIRPGVTGWAQVNGRNAISWEEKFKYDVWYVDNQSIWLDAKIVWKTLRKVMVRDGISPKDEVIMPRFDTMVIKKKASGDA